jgi:peptide/nickel transport system permease protein
MVAFLVRRLLQGVAIIFTVATLTFVLIHAAPGEPMAGQLDDVRMPDDARAELRRQLGLDQPLPTQYVLYMARVARGDLGQSLADRRPVVQLLAETLPRTLLLMSVTLVAGFSLGVLVGALQAMHAGSWGDRIASRLTVALTAIPDFWLGLVLLLVFAWRLRWFPVSGMVDEVRHDYLSPLGRLRDVLRHLALPVATISLIMAAAVARYQRQALLDVLPEDFVRSARAKGIRERSIVLHHALRNALLPTITLLGISLPALVGGSVFVEVIFSWPGMGRAAFDALEARDYPVVLGATLMTSVVVVIGSLAADLLSAAVDPRLRRG